MNYDYVEEHLMQLAEQKRDREIENYFLFGGPKPSIEIELYGSEMTLEEARIYLNPEHAEVNKLVIKLLNGK